MKKKIKYTLALVASIGCGVLLSFASYLQIHDHIYKGLFWNGLLIIFLLFSSSIYLKKLIKGSDNNQTETINPEILSIEQNAKIKTMTIIESITFWCGMILMVYASSQLKEDPQFSYVLFAIASTLTLIWLLSSVIEIFYILKYGKQLDETES